MQDYVSGVKGRVTELLPFLGTKEMTLLAALTRKLTPLVQSNTVNSKVNMVKRDMMGRQTC